MQRRSFFALGTALLATAAVSTVSTVASAYTRATPEQAIAMLDRAVEMFESEGLDAALAAIEDMENEEFHDGDLYVTVTAPDGTLLAHGVSPKLAGKNFMKFKDPDGNLFVAEYIELMSETERGEYTFKWKNAANGEIERKRFFMRKVEDGPIFGVGIYVPN